jgi:phosphonate transport system ATP-binding protein
MIPPYSFIAISNTSILIIAKDNIMPIPSSCTPLLQVKDLGVIYPGGTEAIKQITVDFSKGEFTVLLGLSGAGKSSLLRSLNHLVTPTSGHVISASVGELNSRDRIQQHRMKTAMVFQHHQLLIRQTALQNVLMGRLAFHGFWRSVFPLPEKDQNIAMHCLDRVGLADKALVRVDQLSGGQQQRVGIARALAKEPSIILADEPVASLDPATSERILSLLKAICVEDGITTIVSLHQLEYATRFADRIIGLANAEVVFDAPPDQLNEKQLTLIYQQKGLSKTESGGNADTKGERNQSRPSCHNTTLPLEIAL